MTISGGVIGGMDTSRTEATSMAKGAAHIVRVEADRTAARAVVLTCLVLVVPLRLWTLAAHPVVTIYRLYPAWLQVVTVAVFSAQAVRAVRGDSIRVATAAAFGVSCVAAARQGRADWRSGAWVWWACMAAVQGYTYWRILAADGGGR